MFRLFGEHLKGISVFFLRICVLCIGFPPFSSLPLSTVLSVWWVPSFSPSCMEVHRGPCRLFTVSYLTLITRLDSLKPRWLPVAQSARSWWSYKKQGTVNSLRAVGKVSIYNLIAMPVIKFPGSPGHQNIHHGRHSLTRTK